MDVHPARLQRLGGQRADHDREPARRPRPAVRLRRLAERADPQARRSPTAARTAPGLAGAASRATPRHEKLAAALNIDGPDVIATTGGYFGDAPPYQGHVVLIDRASGRLRAVFNTLCANRRGLLVPSSCPASDSAILSRGGPVVEPGGERILIDTGNGPWNGTHRLRRQRARAHLPGLGLRQSFTPTNQEQLNTSDTDLGSSAPALLGDDRVVLAGKDGIMRVLALSRLDGHPAGRTARRTARRRTPAAVDPRRRRAVHRARRVAAGRAHDRVRGRRKRAPPPTCCAAAGCYRAWQNGTPGTSPVMAGGLLYVYDLSARRHRRLPPRLAAADRQAGRRRRALEQPDRRRRARRRARGQRQRPQAQRHAGDLLGRLARRRRGRGRSRRAVQAAAIITRCATTSALTAEPPGGGRFDEHGDATRRTRLANERTYLAWWRTGLAAFAVSLGAGRLVPAIAGGPQALYSVGRSAVRGARPRADRLRAPARAGGRRGDLRRAATGAPTSDC